VTGGGIVFHAPGDFVFSFVSSIKDPKLPQLFKDKIYFFSALFRDVFLALNIEVQVGRKEGDKDLLYCVKYPNPYELCFKGEKVVAFAFRRFRTHFMIQGIVHLQDGTRYFKHVDSDLVTKGVQQFVSLDDLQEKIIEQLGKVWAF
jgi:lipoate-protein ligase A